MKRSSAMVRFARYVQALPLWVFRFLEWPVVVFLSRHKNVPQALFVLALPRSGSTLTYQMLCHGLSVQYLSNIWNLTYQLPLFGGLLSRAFTRQHQSDFKSAHGFVPAIGGPAEGLRFWDWWLGTGLIDNACERISTKKQTRRTEYLLQVLSVLTYRGRPFVTAYLGHTLVPDKVNKAFPGAVLIRLRRDPVSNALSLLNSMRENDAKWVSVIPHECFGLQDKSDHERVAAQVYWLNRKLVDADCFDAMLTVDYEDLCERPTETLAGIKSWCDQKGLSIEPKFSLPKAFDYKLADLELDLDAIKIGRALDQLETTHGKLDS